jgi:hypothetical protein
VNASCVELRHGDYMFNEPKTTTNEWFYTTRPW